MVLFTSVKLSSLNPPSLPVLFFYFSFNLFSLFFILFCSRPLLLFPHHLLPFHSCLTHLLHVSLFPAGRLCQGPPLPPWFILDFQVGILTLNYPSLVSLVMVFSVTEVRYVDNFNLSATSPNAVPTAHCCTLNLSATSPNAVPTAHCCTLCHCSSPSN
jgi:hypothetical protein